MEYYTIIGFIWMAYVFSVKIKEPISFFGLLINLMFNWYLWPIGMIIYKRSKVVEAKIREMA